MTFDEKSLLVSVAGTARVDDVEKEARARGYTLGVDLSAAGAGAMTVNEWLAHGAPGAPSSFADPSDHLLAGLTATLANGTRLEVRPTPRRAVGPDLVALLVGTRGHLGAIDEAHLRVHRRDARRPSLALPGVPLDPPVSVEEAALMAAIARELGAPPGD